MAADKYDLLLVDTVKGGPKKHQPWYRERLRSKYIDSRSKLNARQWTFINDKMDDFRPGHMHRHLSEPIVLRGKRPLAPVVLPSTQRRKNFSNQQSKTSLDQPSKASLRPASAATAASPPKRKMVLGDRASEEIPGLQRQLAQQISLPKGGMRARTHQRRNTAGVVLPTKAKGIERAEMLEEEAKDEVVPHWLCLEVRDEHARSMMEDVRQSLEKVELRNHGRTSKWLQRPVHTSFQPSTGHERVSPLPRSLKSAPIATDGDSSESDEESAESSRSISPGVLPPLERGFTEQQSRKNEEYRPDAKDVLYDIFENTDSGVRAVAEDLCEWSAQLKAENEKAPLTPEDVCTLFAEFKPGKKKDESLRVLHDVILPADLVQPPPPQPEAVQAEGQPPQRYFEKDMQDYQRVKTLPSEPPPPMFIVDEAHLQQEYNWHLFPELRPTKVNYGAWYLPKKLWKPLASGQELTDPVEDRNKLRQQHAERADEVYGTHAMLRKLIAGEPINLSPR